MPRNTYASFDLASSQTKLWRSIAKALAILASGENSDATAYTLPTSGTAVTATPIATGTADAAGVAALANQRLMGFTVRETGGTPAIASLNLRHGTSVAGAIIAMAAVGASGQQTVWFGPNGIPAASGVFVDRVAGDTDLVLYTAAIE